MAAALQAANDDVFDFSAAAKNTINDNDKAVQKFNKIWPGIFLRSSLKYEIIWYYFSKNTTKYKTKSIDNEVPGISIKFLSFYCVDMCANKYSCMADRGSYIKVVLCLKKMMVLTSTFIYLNNSIVMIVKINPINDKTHPT